MSIKKFTGEGKGRTRRLAFCVLFVCPTGAVHVDTGFPWCACNYFNDGCFTVGAVFVSKEYFSFLREGVTVSAFGIIAASQKSFFGGKDPKVSPTLRTGTHVVFLSECFFDRGSYLVFFFLKCFHYVFKNGL